MIEKRYGKIYFREGWLGLGDYYKITFGGWITMYARSALYLITVKNKHMIDIRNPKPTPPIAIMRMVTPMMNCKGKPILQIEEVFMQ